MIGRGIIGGLALFIALTAAAYFTPLRAPVLRLGGETYPTLQYRLDAQRRTLDTLQLQASNGPLSPAAQNLLRETQRDFASTTELLATWGRAQTRVSPFGFVAWCLDLYPWLLAFGLAFPVFGGLIGAQAAPRAPRRAVEPRAEVPPPPAPAHPIPHRAPIAPPPTPAAPAPARLASPAASRSEAPPPGIAPPPAAPARVRPDFDRIGKPAFRHLEDPATLARHPALEASRPPASPPTAAPSPVPPPPAANRAPAAHTPPPAAPAPAQDDWGFRHQPKPMEARARPKTPPVRSPHALGDDAPPQGP